jgi:hypothetical protein
LECDDVNADLVVDGSLRFGNMRDRVNHAQSPSVQTTIGVPPALSAGSFEELDSLFMLLRGRARLERSKVSPLSGFWVLLSRIEPVFPRFQLSNHTGLLM